MKHANLIHALEASLQEEIAGKDLQIALLEREQQAIRANDVAALELAARELQQALDRELDRAGKRARLLSSLAAALGLAPDARLGAVADALGPAAARLSERRAELRLRCANALRAGRRVSALIRVQGSIVEEALGRFITPDPTGAPLGRGSIVDARA